MKRLSENRWELSLSQYAETGRQLIVDVEEWSKVDKRQEQGLGYWQQKLSPEHSQSLAPIAAIKPLQLSQGNPGKQMDQYGQFIICLQLNVQTLSKVS